MPQPYRGSGDIYFARGIVQHRPELGAYIAEIALLWTLTEEAWAYLLAYMLRFEAGAGITIYQALIGTGAQRAVLNEVADKYLPDELREDFAALMKISKRRATERNAVVHGMWFIDANIPDALVLAPRNVISSIHAKATRKLAEAHFARTAPPKGPSSDFSDWRVYRKEDFKAIDARLFDFFKQLDALIDKLLALRGNPPNQTLKLHLQSESSPVAQIQTKPKARSRTRRE